MTIGGKAFPPKSKMKFILKYEIIRHIKTKTITIKTNAPMTQVIYITPNYEFDIDCFDALPNEEKLHVARNLNEVYIYSLEEFQEEFNGDCISDLGFIYFVNQ